MSRPLSNILRTSSSEHLSGMVSPPPPPTFAPPLPRRTTRLGINISNPAPGNSKPSGGRFRSGSALLATLQPLSWTGLSKSLPPLRVPDELWGAVNAISSALSPTAGFRRRSIDVEV